jgi:hypothetical protein
MRKNIVEGYIYVISNPEFPRYVKIGRTKNVVKRIKKLSTGVPVPYKLLHSELVIDDILVENELHKTFNHLRASGEWFKITDINKIKKQIVDIQESIRCDFEYDKEVGKTTREMYEEICANFGVGGYSGFELDEYIKELENLDADEIEAAIENHARDLRDGFHPSYLEL